MYISAEKQKEILCAVRDCGKIVLSAHDVENPDAVSVKPGAANFVTVYDVLVQKTLIERLLSVIPGASVFAEEQDNDGANFADGFCFVIDPIDGTTNFIHDMRRSALSVALLYNGVSVFAAVYDPYADEIFSAAAGEGACLNGKAISVSGRSLDKALVGFGTAPYDRAVYADTTFSRVKRIFLKCADIRRSGSAALDVCYVACGRLDVFFEDVLSAWDFAAGQLILQEAGGTLTDYAGASPQPGRKSSVLCTNTLLHPQVLQLINQN